MITQEHLEHWLSEIKYALQGVENEIGVAKMKKKSGVHTLVSPTEEVYVSFGYLQEKATTLKGLIKCIEDDIKND